MKQATQFTDRMSKPLQLGDRVAYASYHNLGLTLGTITKVGRVNVHVTPEPTAWVNDRVEQFRPADVVKV